MGFYYNQPQGFYYEQQKQGFYYDQPQQGFYYDQQVYTQIFQLYATRIISPRLFTASNSRF